MTGLLAAVPEQNLTYPFLLLAAMVAVIVIVFLVSMAHKKHLMALAEEHGFTYEEAEQPWEPDILEHVPEMEDARWVQWKFSKQVGDITIEVFELLSFSSGFKVDKSNPGLKKWIEEGFKNAAGRRMADAPGYTMVAFRHPDLNLPQFELSPKSKIVDTGLGNKGVILAEYPRFVEANRLETNDIKAVREIMNDGVADALTPNPGFTWIAHEDTFVAFKYAEKLNVREVLQAVEMGTALVKALPPPPAETAKPE